MKCAVRESYASDDLLDHNRLLWQNVKPSALHAQKFGDMSHDNLGSAVSLKYFCPASVYLGSNIFKSYLKPSLYHFNWHHFPGNVIGDRVCYILPSVAFSVRTFLLNDSAKVCCVCFYYFTLSAAGTSCSDDSRSFS